MTHQPEHRVSSSSRHFPACECPAGCGGRPEAMRRLSSPYPLVRPGDAKPPARPYNPTRRGELVFDVLNNRVGVLMDRIGRQIFLRPERGGAEWEAEAEWLVKPE